MNAETTSSKRLRAPTAAFVREMGGERTPLIFAKTDVVEVEALHLQAQGTVDWHFCHPKFAILWHGRGTTSCELRVDGVLHRGLIPDDVTVTILPPNTEVHGSFEVPNNADYAIVFLDGNFILDHVGGRFNRPLIGRANAALANGMIELRREAMQPDAVFDLYAQGWAFQALAHISRLSGATSTTPPCRGGLAPRNVRRIDDFILGNLERDLSLDELAAVAGLSKHHFLRNFRQSTGETPHQYVMTARLREAKRRLASSAESVTDIALSCGFSNSQHFSATFRKATGLTPSKFRAQSYL